jgi:hypothetical protein
VFNYESTNEELQLNSTLPVICVICFLIRFVFVSSVGKEGNLIAQFTFLYASDSYRNTQCYQCVNTHSCSFSNKHTAFILTHIMTVVSDRRCAVAVTRVCG